MPSRTTYSLKGACSSRTTSGRARASAKNSVKTSAEEEIYLGKGRTIIDDPSKYPTKDSVGVGGWAGGEQGLQQFVAQGQLEEAVIKEGSGALPDAAPKALGEGSDDIYVGKGQFIQDDARRYPSKEDAGLLTGATGGFAGGEVGLQQFLKTQKVEPAAPEVIKERHLQRDAIAAVGVSVLAAASYLAYIELSGQPLPQIPDLPDLSELTAAAKPSLQPSSTSAPVLASPPATAPSLPSLSVSKEQLVWLAGAGGIAGSVVLFQSTKHAISDAGQQLAESGKKALPRLLVLAGACAVYATLLR